MQRQGQAPAPAQPPPQGLPAGGPPSPTIIPIVFDRGLDTSQEASVLPPGFLVECNNWTPEPTGGLRARRHWQVGPNAHEGEILLAGEPWPNTKKIRGMDYVSMGDSDPQRWWMAGLTNPDSAPVNRTQVWATKATFTEGWTFVENLLSVSATELDKNPLEFAKGVGAVLYTHPFMASVRRWQGGIPPAPVDIPATAGRAGRAMVFHKNRFFMGGAAASTNLGHRVYYSKPASYDVWDDFGSLPLTDSGNVNYLSIGADDSEPVEDLARYQNFLFVGKESSLWIVSGDGIDNWQINRLDGASCGIGRCLVPTPSGLVIVGRYQAWIWRGGDPELISPAVEDILSNSGAKWRTCVYINGKVYIASASSVNRPILVFDTVNGTWATEDVNNVNEIPTSLAVHSNRMVGGPRAGTVGMYYRDEPGGDRQKDGNALAPTYSATSVDYTVTSQERPFSVRHVWVRYRQRRGDAATPPLQVKLLMDGVAVVGSNGQDYKALSGKASPPQVIVQRFDFDGRKTGRRVRLLFTLPTTSSEGTIGDIERVDLEVDVLGER